MGRQTDGEMLRERAAAATLARAMSSGCGGAEWIHLGPRQRLYLATKDSRAGSAERSGGQILAPFVPALESNNCDRLGGWRCGGCFARSVPVLFFAAASAHGSRDSLAVT